MATATRYERAPRRSFLIVDHAEQTMRRRHHAMLSFNARQTARIASQLALPSDAAWYVRNAASDRKYRYPISYDERDAVLDAITNHEKQWRDLARFTTEYNS